MDERTTCPLPRVMRADVSSPFGRVPLTCQSFRRSPQTVRVSASTVISVGRSPYKPAAISCATSPDTGTVGSGRDKEHEGSLPGAAGEGATISARWSPSIKGIVEQETDVTTTARTKAEATRRAGGRWSLRMTSRVVSTCQLTRSRVHTPRIDISASLPLARTEAAMQQPKGVMRQDECDEETLRASFPRARIRVR